METYPKFVSEIDFENLEKRIIDNQDESVLNEISDWIYNVFINDDSSTQVYRKLSTLGHILRTDHHVDNMIRIIKNKKNHTTWYAGQTLCNIKTLYAVNQAIDNKLYSDYIISLYQTHLYTERRVIKHLIWILNEGKYASPAKVLPEDLLNYYMVYNPKDEYVKQYLINVFWKHIHCQPQRCSKVLWQLKNFRDEPNVNDIFEEAKSSDCVLLLNTVQKIDLDVDSEYLEHITIHRTAQSLFEKGDHGAILRIIAEYYRPPFINEKKLIIILEYLRKVLLKVMINIQTKRETSAKAEKEKEYHDYFIDLYFLGLIGKYTGDERTYRFIKAFLKLHFRRDNKNFYYRGDAKTLKIVLKTISENRRFGKNRHKFKVNSLLSKLYLSYIDEGGYNRYWSEMKNVLSEYCKELCGDRKKYCQILSSDLEN